MKRLTDEDISLIIEMAWCDKTSFNGIEDDFGLKEQDVMKIMRQNIKPKAYKNWRERVYARKLKHDRKGKDSEKDMLQSDK